VFKHGVRDKLSIEILPKSNFSFGINTLSILKLKEECWGVYDLSKISKIEAGMSEL
jgi:hypothetical protein